MLGIFLSRPSEEIVKKISKLVATDAKYCVFSADPLPEETPTIPQLQPLRAYNFKGMLVATDVRTAEFAIHLNLPSKKFFYIRSMEWMNAPTLRYKDLKKIYLNDEMDLIVSNSRDYKTIANLFKKPKHIIEDWNFGELLHEYQK